MSRFRKQRRLQETTWNRYFFKKCQDYKLSGTRTLISYIKVHHHVHYLYPVSSRIQLKAKSKSVTFQVLKNPLHSNVVQNKFSFLNKAVTFKAEADRESHMQCHLQGEDFNQPANAQLDAIHNRKSLYIIFYLSGKCL